MPRVARPTGSESAEEPIALLGSLVKAGLLRYLRENPDVTIGAISDALSLPTTTIRPRLRDLQAAGLVLADPPWTEDESRRGQWIRYRVDNEAVTDLYLRLGMAIGEF